MRRRSSRRRWRDGVIVNRTAETVVRLLPPLVITEAEIDEGARPSRCGARRRRRRTNDTRAGRRHAALGRGRRKRRSLHALIAANLEEGHLLPRTLDELRSRRAFVVAIRGHEDRRLRRARAAQPSRRRSPLARRRRGERGRGVGTQIVEELRRRARAEGFEKLCAFTHAPGVLHPDGLLDRAAPVAAREDLHRLPQVSALPPCGQYAMVVPLDPFESPTIGAAPLESIVDAGRPATAAPVA